MKEGNCSSMNGDSKSSKASAGVFRIIDLMSGIFDYLIAASASASVSVVRATFTESKYEALILMI